MKISDFIFPVFISSAVHLSLFLWGASGNDPEALFVKGASAVSLNIAPSAASRMLTPPAAPHAVANPAKPKPNPPEPPAKSRPSGQIASKHSPSPEIPEQAVKSEPYSHARRTGEINHGNQEDREGDLGKKGAVVSAEVVGLSTPEYPRYSRRYGEQGTVILSVEIRTNREHGKIMIVDSSGYPRLDRAAVKALEKATFIPATKFGRKVSSMKQIAFIFKLEDAASTP